MVDQTRSLNCDLKKSAHLFFMRAIFLKQVEYGGHDGANHFVMRAKVSGKVVLQRGLLVIGCDPVWVCGVLEWHTLGCGER